MVNWREYHSHFRGSPQTIRERLRQHIVHLSKVSALPGRALDLGCGRGEWLEILEESSITATGVDTDRNLIDELNSRGFDGVCSTASDFLRGQPEQSFSVVSSFHMLEHLPLDGVAELLNQVFRVLIPGGLFIAETPNALNLYSASSTFWIDPTHIRPIHPDVLHFLLERAGFSDLGFSYLNPLHTEVVTTGHNQIDHLLRAYFGPQDLGVCATRPHQGSADPHPE